MDSLAPSVGDWLGRAVPVRPRHLSRREDLKKQLEGPRSMLQARRDAEVAAGPNKKAKTEASDLAVPPCSSNIGPERELLCQHGRP